MVVSIRLIKVIYISIGLFSIILFSMVLFIGFFKFLLNNIYKIINVNVFVVIVGIIMILKYLKNVILNVEVK